MSDWRVKPSEARRRILEQHEQIRALLGRLDELAHKILQGDAMPSLELRRRAMELTEGLADHMAFEESVLVPALQHIDPWGPERVERLQAEHKQQLEILDALAEGAQSPSRSYLDLALMVLGFVSLLREDMEAEESAVLRENLLRDDPIIVNPEPE